jgi:hypothetical protein
VGGTSGKMAIAETQPRVEPSCAHRPVPPSLTLTTVDIYMLHCSHQSRVYQEEGRVAAMPALG